MRGPDRTAVHAKLITPGTPVTAGRAVLISCTVAGLQKLLTKGGDTITTQVAVGATVIQDLAVVDAPSSGSTATATVYVLS